MSSRDINELLAQLAWSQWTELGARGVERRHASWSVDPEALLVLTAALAELDPRLRDESLDWCLKYRRYLSRSRLRHALSGVHDDIRAAYDRYAATLSHAGASSWPAKADPWPFTPTSKSELADLRRPALVRLRLRAIFGVSARAEIIHALTWQARDWVGSAELARLAGYTKRNIDDELDGLERAGLVEAALSGNRRLVRLLDVAALQGLVGPAPKHVPDWFVLVRVLTDVQMLAKRVEDENPQVRDVEATRLLDELARLARQPFVPRLPAAGRSAWQRLDEWTLRLARQLASGRPPPSRPQPQRPRARAS